MGESKFSVLINDISREKNNIERLLNEIYPLISKLSQGNPSILELAGLATFLNNFYTGNFYAT